MPVTEIKLSKIVKHCLNAAIINLFMQRPKVISIPELCRSYRKCCIPSLMLSRRDHPTRLCEHHHVKKVPHLNNIKALPLNRQRWLSDHSLQAADATLVAAPIRLIGNEQNAALQMPIKFAYHLDRKSTRLNSSHVAI